MLKPHCVLRREGRNFVCKQCGIAYRFRVKRKCTATENLSDELLREILKEVLLGVIEKCGKGAKLNSLQEALSIVDGFCVGCSRFVGSDCLDMIGCKNRTSNSFYGVTSSYTLRLLGILFPCERWQPPVKMELGDSEH